MGKIQTVLFDLDGTLIDSRLDLANAVNYALEMVGLPRQSEEEIIPHVGNGLRTLLGEVMGPVTNEALDAGIRAFSMFYDDHCVDHTQLYDQVKDLVSVFSREHRIGIVTNKPERFANKIVYRLGLAEAIHIVIGGDTLAERKPHPAPVLKAVRELGGDFSAALMVGDGFQDIQAGQAAGIRTCVARYGYGFRHDSLELKPDFQINRFIELKEIVS